VTLLRASFAGTTPAAAALTAAGAGIVVFVAFALPRATGAAAVFAAGGLLLVVGAGFGPAAFRGREGDARYAPVLRALVRCAAFTVVAAAVLAGAAIAGDGPLGPVAPIAAFAGLHAFTFGAVAYACGGGAARVLVPALAMVLLATLFYWDDVALRGAPDRTARIVLAYDLNAAAAVAVTAGFDWPHAPRLYRNNETAEALIGGAPAGTGPFARRLGWIALGAALAGLWRRP
jgi:hypothetical protein